MISRPDPRRILPVLLLLPVAAWVVWMLVLRPPHGVLDASAPEGGSLQGAAIRTAARLQREWLAADVGPAPHAGEVARYHRLRHALQDPATRGAAEEELFERWRERPDHFLWIETAVVNYRLLERKDRYVALRRLAAGEDSTSAVARYVQGRRGHGRSADARRSYELAVRRQHDLDPLQRLWLHLRLADLESLAGRHRQASRRLLDLLPEAWDQGGPPLAALWWRRLAGFARQDDRLEDAMLAATAAIACAEAAADPSLTIEARLEVGHVHEARLEYPSARRVYEDCLQAATALGLVHLQRRSVNFLGLVHSMQGDLEAELAAVGASLDLARRTDDREAVLRSTVALANCQRRLGRLAEARALLEDAEALHAGRGDAGSRHFLLDTVWQLYFLQIGDYAAADSLLGLQGDDAARLEPVVALIEQGLGAGRPDLAYRGLERAERILAGPLAGKVSYEERLALSVAAARFLARQGEFRLAEQELQRAAAVLAGNDLPEWRWEIDRAAGALARLAGDLDRAEECFARCLQVAGRIGDPYREQRSRVLLGQVLIERGRGAEAADLFRTAREAPEYWPRLAAALYLGLAAARQADHQAALAHLAAADSLLRPDAPGDLLARLRLEQGKALAALQRPREALAFLRAADPGTPAGAARPQREALLAFDAEVRRERAESLIGLLHDAPDLAGPDGPAAEALALAAGLRWRVGPDRGVTQPMWASPTPPLRPGSPVLATFLGRRRCFAWLGTPAGWTMWELPAAPALRDMARAVIADREAFGRRASVGPARALAEALLGPVAPHWRQGEVLHLVADGILAGLPWAALPLPAPDGRQRGLLVDHGPLAHLASLDPALDRRGHADGPLLALGLDGWAGPGHGDAPILRHAEAEARQVAALWPSGRATLLLGEQAGWPAVRSLDLRRFSAIHIATHATVAQGLPGATTLRLASAGGATPLTLPEIAELDLAADLVYLSCCEAADPTWDTASALNSFTRAFMQAGAAAVIAPTTRVEDEAARRLALRFYTHARGGASLPEALRRAQRDLKQTAGHLGHPAAWAFYGCYLAGPAGGPATP